MAKLRELEVQRDDLLEVADSYRKQQQDQAIAQGGGNGAILSIDLSNRANENMPGKVVELMGSSRGNIETLEQQHRYQVGCTINSNDAGMLPQFGAALTT